MAVCNTIQVHMVKKQQETPKERGRNRREQVSQPAFENQANPYLTQNYAIAGLELEWSQMGFQFCEAVLFFQNGMFIAKKDGNSQCPQHCGLLPLN